VSPQRGQGADFWCFSSLVAVFPTRIATTLIAIELVEDGEPHPETRNAHAIGTGIALSGE
jgi:hypothetical protein